MVLACCMQTDSVAEVCYFYSRVDTGLGCCGSGRESFDVSSFIVCFRFDRIGLHLAVSLFLLFL